MQNEKLKIVIGALFLVLCFFTISFTELTLKKKIPKKEATKKMKKVVMIIAKDGFRDEEYFQPKEILVKSKVEVVTASSSKGTAKGMLGADAFVDISINEIDVKNYDAVVFVGGVGSSEYWDNATAHKIAQGTIKWNKILAAICIAPVTLARAGLLKNKKATVFSSEADELKESGAIYTGKNVEIDGNIVTASGPQSAKEFGKKILEILNKNGGEK
ncbi:MAG: DJ-1/PfpI family protein [Elusimicrobia bacterium]|nr:DJ-1/PfpI family protein [Elusimicrobiota bacterium]